jgi:hexosaminidase
LQLFYLTFTDPRFDENEFQTGIQQIKAILPNIEKDPDFRFQIEKEKVFYNNNPRVLALDAELLDKANLATIERGKPAIQKKENIIGVQGQLWTETNRGYSTVQLYVFPKIFGIIERGWNSYPAWGADNEDSKQYLDERAHYNLVIGTKELPQLAKRGANFHLGQPGIIKKDGMLLANKQYPGVVIRYTFDGSTPTEKSPEWTAPVSIPSGTKVVKARAFYLNKQSVTTFLFIE